MMLKKKPIAPPKSTRPQSLKRESILNASHHLAPFERGHVRPVQFKPFAIGPLVGKPLVPVGFNSKRVIGPDDMHGVGWVWHLDSDGLTARGKVISCPNLVPAP